MVRFSKQMEFFCVQPPAKLWCFGYYYYINVTEGVFRKSRKQKIKKGKTEVRITDTKRHTIFVYYKLNLIHPFQLDAIKPPFPNNS